MELFGWGFPGETEEFVSGRVAVCARDTVTQQNRKEAGRAIFVRGSMGVLVVQDMRKDSPSGVSWRYGVRLLYLGCVCVAGSASGSSPERAGATDVDGNARRFLAIPDNKRYAKAR